MSDTDSKKDLKSRVSKISKPGIMTKGDLNTSRGKGMKILSKRPTNVQPPSTINQLPTVIQKW